MTKIIDNLTGDIKKQVDAEYKRVHKKFNFIKNLITIDYSNNDKLFRNTFACICDKTKEVNVTVTSQSVDMIFKDGKFLVDNQEVDQLFGKAVYIKNNILTFAGWDVVIDLSKLKDIAFDKLTFNKCVKFMEQYSDLLGMLSETSEEVDKVRHYLQSLKRLQLNNDTDIDSVDIDKLKKAILKYNKEYEKFVTKFNDFASPYNIMISL